MKNIIDRLVKYMEFKGLNPNKITKEAKLSIGLIGKAIVAKKGLHSDTIEKILHAYPEINTDWFVLGKGNMLKDLELDTVNEPTHRYSTEQKSSELVNSLLKQVDDLRKDKEELRNDKKYLQDIIDHKLGKQNAS